MALVVDDLKQNIEQIFSDMNEMTGGGNQYMAENLALAIKDFISDGVVTSLDDSGTIGSNTYSGTGTGNMTIDEESLAEEFLSVFEDENVNDTSIAEGMADAIDKACSETDIVETETIGTQTPPSGTPTPASGTGLGTFSGTKSIISAALIPAFAAMLPLKSGGNAIFANALATSINTYLLGGSINITLQEPIVGSATGKIA